MISTNPKKPFAYLAVAALSTFAAAPAMAAPAPTPHHFVIEQDFESGMRTFDPVVIDGVKVFRWWGNPPNPSVSNERPKDGNYSMKFRFDGGGTDKGAASEQRFEIPGGTSSLTIQYDLFVPENFYHRKTGRGINNKFLVLWSGLYGSSVANNSAAFEYWPSPISEGDSRLSYHLGYAKKDTSHEYPSTDLILNQAEAGQWVNIKVKVKLSEPGKSNGELTVWKNGSVYLSKAGLDNYSSYGNYVDRGYLFGTANSGFDEDTEFFIDNLRIELDNYIYRNTKLINFRTYTVTGYDPDQDHGLADTKLQGHDFLSIKLTGNAWKKITFPYTITPNTVIEFDYSSDAEAEIEAIGTAKADKYDQGATFKLAGTQGSSAGIKDFDNYPGNGIKHYEIPVGQYVNGEYKYLTFIRDNDVASPTGYSLFSNIRFYEKETTNN
ncbi:hypothetical protein ONV78_01555 [Hahella sp. CR1]|uniref:hypothetical protein n=1 Tax=Hahella sp. CR1 TaxID=2992807 RepID=UPI0024427DAB|nr:hypothetical protein [Hahella sp. CR1]MDG9666401.1 hypothetical protein [Hahella sp. CR1]